MTAPSPSRTRDDGVTGLLMRRRSLTILEQNANPRPGVGRVSRTRDRDTADRPAAAARSAPARAKQPNARDHLRRYLIERAREAARKPPEANT